MTPEVWRLALVAALLGVVAAGCGGDDADPQTSTGGSAGSGGAGGEGGVTPDLPGAILPCPAGELAQDDQSCLPPGIPADGCGTGFTHDGDRGCEPVLPAEPCGTGQLAVPGDTSCRPVTACVSSKWGTAPTGGTTEHVDGSYQGTSTGSETQPWKTIQAGINAAAPGAVVAVAAGTYNEAVTIAQGVSLWGACADTVTIAAPGNSVAVTVQDSATTVVVRDLAITGSDIGLWAIGPDDLLVDRVWVHHTGERGLVLQAGTGPVSIEVLDSLIEEASYQGVAVHGVAARVERSVVRDIQEQNGWGSGLGVYLEPSGRGELTIRTSVVEGSPGLGVLARGSDLVLEDSVVRDSHPRLDMAQGLGILGLEDGLDRASLTVRGSLVETAYMCGICADDSDLTVERTVVRDILPEPADLGAGYGIRVFGIELGFSDRPTGLISQSVIERTHATGLLALGAEVDVTALVVRDIEPRGDDQTRGRGIYLGYSSGASEQRTAGSIRGCLVERAHEAGIMVAGSDADIDSCAVFDTQSRELDGLVGAGVIYVRNMPVISEGAAGTLRRTVVQEARAAGVAVLASELTVTDVIVRDSLRQDASDDFGDGIAVSSTLVIVPGYFPTQVDITRATVERSSRCALSAFAAPIGVADSLMDCNPIDMNGEEENGESFTIEDLGGNLCGCTATDEVRMCQVLSTGLEPPVGL
ncbi:MAG: DUF1565 domain-containing protein [Deltaproteobacteria bacterium]|nr:DUF1565 domain-containing protein [Deltaproteobacteria bacterium]